ncbi:MAG TPA: hypothetical protein VNO69_11265 [Methyloceanibacter sp.]|nr:hypothetical protein [Methyloceanibacter sp.]
MMVKPGASGAPEGVSGTGCLNFAVSLLDGGGYHSPGTSKGRHALPLPPRNPNLPYKAGDMAQVKDRQTGAVAQSDEFSAEQIGWRFALGTLLIFGGYAAWLLLPFVIASDLAPTAKAVLSGVIGATPFLSKVLAVVLMGRPAYQFLKKTVFKRLRRKSSSATE